MPVEEPRLVIIEEVTEVVIAGDESVTLIISESASGEDEHVGIEATDAEFKIVIDEEQIGVVEILIPGPQGPPGLDGAKGEKGEKGDPGEGDKFFLHRQELATSLWTINHELGKYPAITVVDSAGTVIVGEIEYLNTDIAVVGFSAPFSGTAFCN